MNTALLPRPLLADPPEPYDGMPVSEADYWEFYYLGHEVTYEWNNGVLEEKGVSDYLTFQVFDWFIQLLIEFLRTHPIADRVGLEMGFRLALPSQVAIRRPDYGVVLHHNPASLTGPDQSYQGIFDLCIEGVSTSSRAMQERDTVVKKGEYAAGGVREYYFREELAERLPGILRLLPELEGGSSGLDFIRSLLRYLAQVVGMERLSEARFRQAVTQALSGGDEQMMTIAEQWVQQGLVQGRQEGRWCSISGV